MPTTEAVRSERFKYVEHRGEPAALFDLDADPGEQRSLLDEPEGRETAPALRARLAALRGAVRAGKVV